MFFKCGADCFNSDHIARIRRITERDPQNSPVRYEVRLVNITETAVIVGDDLPAFETWLKKECPRLFEEAKPEAKKVA